MKTINKNLKVTGKEFSFLQEQFNNGYTLHRKVKLYGAGHPALLDVFFVKGTEAQRNEFWNDHETTHAKIISYESIEDMQQDDDLYRSDLVFTEDNEIDQFALGTYYL